MKLFMFSILAGVFMLALGIAGAQGLRNKDVTIPFQLVNKTIFVQVRVGRSKPLWFVLDTGDKYALIDLSIAKSLGLELGDPVPVGGGGKETVLGNFLRNSEFSIAGLESFSQPLFIAVPLDELAKASGHEFAGVLGFDFISKFVVEIDYLTQTITLHDNTAYQYRGDGERFKIIFNAAGHPEMRAQVIDGAGSPIDGTFVIDIGSGAALILNKPFVERERFLQSGRPTVHWLEGRGFGGSIEGSVGRITGLKLGRFLVNKPITVFSQASNGPFASADSQGNIGAAILEKFKVILDYKQNRVILEPNAQFNKPLEYNRSGLFLVASGQDYKTFTIDTIADHSPASEVGLYPGDILVAINTHPAADYSLSQLRLMFQNAKECDLTLERGGDHLHVQLKLRGQI
jgi:Aspartyl protease